MTRASTVPASFCSVPTSETGRRTQIERRDIERHEAVEPAGVRPPACATRRTGQHMRVLHSRRGVAFEPIAREAESVGDRRIAEREFLGLLAVERTLRARLLPLRLHGGIERGPVDRQLPLAREVLDEVQRQAERVVEAEGLVARHRTADPSRSRNSSSFGRPLVSTVSKRCSSARMVWTIVSRLP